MKKIVLSAINFSSGGPLSILSDCLKYAASELAGKYEIHALVHDRNLFAHQKIRFRQFPCGKKSWIHRVFSEYLLFRRISLQLQPYLWFSLHDMTPNVRAERRAVYCHNPAPFYPPTMRNLRLDPSFVGFNLFYRWLYAINIGKNDRVIVQQDWIRERFRRMFGIDNVVVCYPEVPGIVPQAPARPENGIVRFVYPAFPRVFKNVEVVGDAVEILRRKGMTGFEVSLTISGRENRYAQTLFSRYGRYPEIRFLGAVSREQVFELYGMADWLLFPSKLETWGLPISEFKAFGKPMLVADCPYARETVGGYPRARFFDPDSAEDLASTLCDIMAGRIRYSPTSWSPPAQPFVRGWGELFRLLLD